MPPTMSRQLNRGVANTRLLRICPPPPHLDDFRAAHGLDHLSFDEQIHLLRKENLLLPGGWAAAMAQEGFDVFETICGDIKLQEVWARENAIAVEHSDVNWSTQILVEQVKAFQPGVIFIYAGAFSLGR